MTSVDSSKFSLFLDSSENLIYGLLDENFNWFDFQMDLAPSKGTPKHSEVLHFKLYELTQKYDIAFKDIKKIFAVVGPGSYTGIRLAMGLAKILEWNGASLYTFYHHDIPYCAGIYDYQFTCEAFKGEIFDFRYENGQTISTLVKEDCFKIVKKEIYNRDNTVDLLKNNSHKIFSYVVKNNIAKAPYYFRPIELEFKKESKN